MRIEAVAQAGPGARKWFQLHVRRGRENSTGLLQCAWENGWKSRSWASGAMPMPVSLTSIRTWVGWPGAAGRTLARARTSPWEVNCQYGNHEVFAAGSARSRPARTRWLSA